MAIGDVHYGEFGLTKIDSYSSSTTVTEISVDIQNVAEDTGFVIIVGTFQCASNGYLMHGSLKDNQGNKLNCSYRTMRTGSNTFATTAGTANGGGTTTNVQLIPSAAVNANYTTYNPVSSSSTVGMSEFMIKLSTYKRNASPWKRVTGFSKVNYYQHGSYNAIFSAYSGFTCLSSTTPTEFAFSRQSTVPLSITGHVDVYSLCRNPL
jgi:hypothetical protein